MIARGLTKSFGHGHAARRVLDAADLDVAPGTMVAVIGRSGSGKSTLLHLLGAIDRPDAGTVAIGGAHLHEMGERALTEFRRTGVGFVFQLSHLVPELTGEENVLLPARLVGAESLARGARLIDDLGLRDVAGHLPHTLSGGEQQRFAIARALVNGARLLLADEPTGNLDNDSREAVLELLRDQARGARSVVLVTHDLDAAGRADRVLVLERGRLRPA